MSIKSYKLLPLSLALIPLLHACSTTLEAQPETGLSFDTVTRDITYLASDELKGRGNFSEEINLAADYIAKRFEQIGLKPLSTEPGYLQGFSLFEMTPESLTVSIDGKSVDARNLAMASTTKAFSWNDVDAISLHKVSANDDMREVVSKANQQGGDHLILIDAAHKDWFARYQAYFALGLRKNTDTETGAIVLVLTEELTASTIDVSGQVKVEKRELANVVAVLPGKSRPDEVVLYSAHYDHLGQMGDGQDVIYNGADDDASGTTAVINLAQHFAKQGNNERTLMFAAFTAEEIGGFGSQHFSKQLSPDDIVAMINIEMIGKPSKFGAGTMWMTGAERSDLQQHLNAKLEASGGEIYTDPYPEQQLFYRSDNATLAGFGVPAHSFSSTQLDKDQHYHKVTDDLASLNLDSMYRVIQKLAVATEDLNNGKVTPSRIEPLAPRSNGLIY